MLLFVEYVCDLKEILSAIRGDMRLQGGQVLNNVEGVT